MAILKQLCFVFAICLVAEAISSVLPFTLPASVIGIILLLVLLAVKAVKPKDLKEVSDFLLDNMALFFIPVVSSMIQYKDVLFANFWAIVLICLLTTPLVFFVTGHVVQLTVKLLRRKEKKDV
ncbi:MAG: CidA/LrgA family protein [Oscillospiraceae bacterium]|nr:CidA/LrgA family protein [Oscillospiraceae bacterium]